MIALALAFSLLASGPVQATPQQVPAADAPVRLEDIEVSGRPLDEMIDAFVGTVSAPVRNRGLARWRQNLCVGVVNLRTETAQVVADRISADALALGLTPGLPGCRPNIIVIATVNANDFTRTYVAQRPRLFRMGGAGMDRGDAALRDFQDTDRPVRWWAVSIPADRDTGARATRMPGQFDDNGGGVAAYAPTIKVPFASRLRTQVVDDMVRVFVVVDVDRLGAVTSQQLGDYIAMVALAQIDPRADTGGYATILNVFADPGVAEGLTNWDKAYLEGLYGAERSLRNHASYLDEVAGEIGRAHRRLRAAGDE